MKRNDIDKKMALFNIIFPTVIFIINLIVWLLTK